MRKPKSKATEFTGQKFRWLEQIARAGRELPSLAPAVAIEFSHYFDLAEGGAAWPWQDAIAQALGVRREAVNRVINALVEHGDLTVTRQGRDRPNIYRFVLKDGDGISEPKSQKLRSRCAQPRTSSDPKMCADDVRERRLRCAQNRTDSSSKTPGASLEAPKERECRELALTCDPDPGDGAALTAAAPEEFEASEQEILPPSRIPVLNHEKAWHTLRALWNRGWAENDRADRAAFMLACHEGADPADIIEVAGMWVAAADAPRFLPALHKWLTDRGWAKTPPKPRGSRAAGERGRRSYGKPDMFKVCMRKAGYIETDAGEMVHPDDVSLAEAAQ
jgi:hypothetical protein